MAETIAYSMRYAGLKTKQIAISMSFVTATLLITRLSNMCQAPFLGLMVDQAILNGFNHSTSNLIFSFRLVILAAACGVIFGMCLTPSMVRIFQHGILSFLKGGSLPLLVLKLFHPRKFLFCLSLFSFPKFSMFRNIVLSQLPKGFLLANIGVASIHCIGVMCALLAGAFLPDYRATAIQLSGIVNGIATILLTMFVDPPGARVTDEAVHGKRDISHVKSVVFFMQLGKLLGVLCISQFLLIPLSRYIMWVAVFLTEKF